MKAQDIEGKIARRLLLSCLIFFPLVAAINASSIVSEAARRGAPVDWRVPWALEFTSIIAMVIPILFTVALERRFPLMTAHFPRHLLVLIAGSAVFSLLHIGGMAAIRAVIIPPLSGQEYQLLADPVRDMLYEYRRGFFPYCVIIGLLTLYRRLSANDPQKDGTEGRRACERMELRSGAHTIRIDTAAVEWAQAAGNYVELHAAGQSHLPRITLNELEQRLRDAGIDMVRVHKSYIVNRRVIVEVLPTGTGDLMIRLVDGSEIRGSRRYRDRLGV